ncbi:MAG: arsenate reductase (glutaredoxin) [Wenzhouxiangella sp.]|nr:MAG: arsenate reductase (glutaredoxin) [Wenzhouxiangella sp.]
MTIKLYHNPRCSKSRQTLALLQHHGHEPEIIEYLKTPPDADDLKRIIACLGLPAHDLIRPGENAYKTLGLSPDANEQRLIEAMVTEPTLIQRPIVINGDQARIGRPPETVLEIL